jgi:hypothetical protein
MIIIEGDNLDSTDDGMKVLTTIPPGMPSSTRRTDLVYRPNRLSTHSSHQLLFVILGIVLSSTIITLIGIMIACAWQQRRRSRMLGLLRRFFYLLLSNSFSTLYSILRASF